LTITYPTSFTKWSILGHQCAIWWYAAFHWSFCWPWTDFTQLEDLLLRYVWRQPPQYQCCACKVV